MKGSTILASAARAASYNMILQFSLRITTFALNGFILRYVSRELLGVVNVRLTLLYSTTLFLAKEAFDRACLSKGMKRDWIQVINILWCTVPLALICTTVLSMVWVHLLEQPAIESYSLGVICFALSSTIEMLAEPLFVIGQSFMFVKLKVMILGISQGMKCLITFCLVVIYPAGGVLNFCVAQIVSSASYSAMYHFYFARYIHSSQKKDDDFPLTTVRDIFPKSQLDKPFIDWELASLVWSFFKQSFLKQILTEGEKYVMTFFDVLSFGDQGVFDVINNLGSMAARFIFLPIEENIYLFFSQMITRGQKAEEQSEETLTLCAKALTVVLKLVTLIGLIIVVFGHTNAYLALHLYGGTMLTEGNGPVLLRWYCLYVLVIAINGTTEAFFFAAMSKKEVDKYNQKMLIFSVLFLASSWFLTSSIGSVGFILANCFNMIARIVHSAIFINTYFHNTSHRPLQRAIPTMTVFVSLLFSFIITYLSESIFCTSNSLIHKFIHVVITGVSLLCVFVCIYFTDKEFVNTVKQQVMRSRSTSSQEEKDKQS